MVNRETIQMSENKRTANLTTAAGKGVPLPDPGDLMAVVNKLHSGNVAHQKTHLLGTLSWWKDKLKETV